MKQPRESYGFVYLVTNKVTGETYVGKTKHSIAQRWGQHRSDAAKRGSDIPLHRAIREYGGGAFVSVEVFRASSEVELDKAEAAFVALHGSNVRGRGYNVRAGGKGGGKWSPEMCLRLGEARKGRPAPNKGKPMPEHQRLALIARLKIKHPCTGRILSEETKAKIGAANKIHRTGKTQSPEQRRRRSESLLKHYADPEARRKLGLSRMGQVTLEETREKLREKMLGREIRPEWREKLRQANLGKKHSDDTRRKISESNLRRHARRRAQVAA